MTRRIKFLLGSIVLALGFLFCVVGLSVNAKVEAEQPATDEQQEVVGVYYVDEQEGKAEFTLYSNNTFSATAHDNASNEDRETTGTYLIEGNIVTFDFENGKTFKTQISGNKLIAPQEETEQPEEQEEAVEDKEEKSLLETAEFIIKFLQNTNIESVKTRFYSLLAGLGIDLTLLGVLIIWLIKLKVKQFRSSENWQELKAKLDVKHQQEMEQKADEYEEKLDEVKNILLEQIKSLDDEKKKVAANNIALLKDNLQDIKEDLEK